MSAAEFAGTLRETVTVERLDPARDGAGGPAGTWSTVATAAAALVPAGNGALETADTLAAPPLWRVWLRAADVLVGDRLGWRGRRLAVRAVTADPATPDRMALDCEEERP